jgi:hypothetical protein
MRANLVIKRFIRGTYSDAQSDLKVEGDKLFFINWAIASLHRS